MARKSYKRYWHIPIEYIEEIARLREKIRIDKCMRNGKK